MKSGVFWFSVDTLSFVFFLSVRLSIGRRSFRHGSLVLMFVCWMQLVGLCCYGWFPDLWIWSWMCYAGTRWILLSYIRVALYLQKFCGIFRLSDSDAVTWSRNAPEKILRSKIIWPIQILLFIVIKGFFVLRLSRWKKSLDSRLEWLIALK